MKKLIASALIAFLATATIQSYAQNVARAEKKELRKENELPAKTARKTARKALRKLEGTEVSQLSKDAFYADFGKAGNVNWVRKTQLDEATFTNKGTKTTAYYDYTHKLVGTTVDKKYSDLPAAARKEIEKQYKDKGYVIGAVTMFDDNEANDSDMILYGSQFEGADHYFVEVSKAGKQSILMVNPNSGEVSYFQEMR